MTKLLLLAPIGACVLAACSSLNSTYVGDAKTGTKFEGMPIVVQRPKYLKLTYKRVTYQLLGKKTVADSKVGTTTEPVVLSPPTTVDEISTEVITVGEVYALDLKRPAAGTTEYAVEFETGSQYPKKLGAKIDDKTIDAVNELLQKGVAAVFKPAAATGDGFPAEVRKIAEHTERIELRSLDDPNKVHVIFSATSRPSPAVVQQ